MRHIHPCFQAIKEGYRTVACSIWIREELLNLKRREIKTMYSTLLTEAKGAWVSNCQLELASIWQCTLHRVIAGSTATSNQQPATSKGVHCVDLGESFPTSIYLQKSASIQPRTSPSKFGGKFNSIFTSLLIHKRRAEVHHREWAHPRWRVDPGRLSRRLAG